MKHPVPRAHKSAWFYVLGSATLIAFLIQIVTGIALASGYVPSSGQAYDTLVFITGTSLGRIVRGIHAFGASAMIILIGLHAIRVYLMAAYKYPRQMNWLTGAGLLMLTLLMAFTGQLLRWDQTGFWSVVIAAEQAGRTPVIGNWLGHFILAGDTVGGATLSRFFAAHVFFIPALIFLLLGSHLYLVLHNGISEPPEAGRPVDPKTLSLLVSRFARSRGPAILAGCSMARCGLRVPRGRDRGGPGDRGWPSGNRKTAGPDHHPGVSAAGVVLSLVLCRALVDPKMVGRLGDHSRACAVRQCPHTPAVGGGQRRTQSATPPMVFCDRSVHHVHDRVLRKRRIRRAVVASHGGAALPAQVVGVTDGLVADGARVFHDKGCENCHTVSGYGGIRGPDLTYAADTMTPAQMTTRIYSGATNMPSYNGNLTSDQLSALLAFLGSRHRQPVLPVPEAAH